jgi:ribosomal protein S18 acetylase RimI-like enzyme
VTVELRRIRAGDAERLRELRLRALREAPTAFADTFEQARALPLGRWEMWATGEANVTVVADDGDRWIGMVAGRLLADDIAWLEALWVDPSARRTGVGSALIAAVAAWARERGAARLDLSVTTNNTAAAAFYEDAGFVATGRRRPLPADPSRTEVFLSQRL